MYSFKRILGVSHPIFFGLLAQNIINVTDTAFMGRVGEVELGASVMGGLFYICIFTVLFGFSTGAQIIIARRNGEGRLDLTGQVMIQGTLFLLVLTLGACLLTWLFGRGVMRFIVSSDAVFVAASEFLMIRVWGLFFSSFNVMFRAFYVGVTHTGVLTSGSLVMAIVNIFFDYSLVFGHFGMPAMGLAGAAVASVIAEGVTTAFYFFYTRLKVCGRVYGLDYVDVDDFRGLRKILSISSFTMLQYFFSNLTYFFFFIAVEHLGQVQLAAANIVRSIYVVILIPIQAYATAANSLVSNLIGEGGLRFVVRLLRRITFLSFVTVVGICLLVGLMPRVVLGVYTANPVIIEGGVRALYAVLLSSVLSAVSMIYFSGISGTGDTRTALFVETGCSVFYVLWIVVSAIGLHASVAVCFGCEAVYYFLVLLCSVWYLRRMQRRVIGGCE